MIANGLVRGALPALGQPKTPATIPHSHRRGKEFRHRSSARTRRAGPSQLGCCVGLAGIDREFPRFTVRSGTQRARGYFGEHLIRRHGQVVQNCPGVAACWADVPGLSFRVGSWLGPWQQFWQQPTTAVGAVVSLFLAVDREEELDTAL